MSEAAYILLGAVFIDIFFGEYPEIIHPTVVMGRVIGFFKKTAQERKLGFYYGVFAFLLTCFLFSFSSLAILKFSESFVGAIKILLGMLILKSAFSWRALRYYALEVKHELENNNLESARKTLPALVGRDASRLEKKGMISAAVESIGESLCDSMIAPLFYFFIFSLYSIELGISAAVFYRAVNTLDSMIGYREFDYGTFSAKADEFLNFIPSRFSAILMLLSGVILRKNLKYAIKIFSRDRRKTESINAGQGIAMMAGLLEVELEKAGFYKIGNPEKELEEKDIEKALRIFDLSAGIFAMLILLFLFL